MATDTTRDTIRRLIDADVAYTIARMQVLERIPGNPIGIAYRTIDDHVTALMARHLPSPSFNRVVGLRAGDERHIAPLVDWYRQNGGAGRFEMIPGHFDAALGRALARHGYCHSDFQASLICAGEPAVTPDGPAIEPVTDAATMEDFLAAYVAGWTLPAKDNDRFKANVRPWREQPGWSLYLARLDGQPAAAATLYLRDGVGYLADAATDPAWRGRGLHAALLARRIADARTAGADLIFSGAEYLSGSYRNMERAGMQLVFMRAIWTPLPAPG